jgi:early secretory antigenic target protein ESAT-6
MTHGQLVVNFGALAQASGDIKHALDKLEHHLQELDTHGKSLMHTWDGAARNAYLARQQKWTAAAHDLSDILRHIQRALHESHNEYASTEKRATSLFE